MGSRHNCPYCGGSLITKIDRHPLAQRLAAARSQSDSKKYSMTSWKRNPETDEFEREDEERETPIDHPSVQPGSYREVAEKTPIHAPSLQSQWATPTAKALTVWTGTSALSFAVLAGYVSAPRPGLAAFIIGGIPGAYQWARDQEFFKDAVYQVKNLTEEILQQDIDGDGSVGEPKEISRPEPGTVIINGRQVPQESEASKKRRAMVGLAEIVWKRQNADPPLKTGVKALLEAGNRLPGGYKIGYDLHKELGQRLIQAGYAESKTVGQNETWQFLDGVRLDEVVAAFGVWDDD